MNKMFEDNDLGTNLCRVAFYSHNLKLEDNSIEYHINSNKYFMDIFILKIYKWKKNICCNNYGDSLAEPNNF